MKVRPITSALALTTATLVLTGCVSSSGSEDDDIAVEGSSAASGTVVIGVVMAKSGFMGPIDTPALNSMLLEAEALNEDGGIGGMQIDMQVIDTETKLDRYASAAAELLAKDAKALVVTCDYDVSSPAALAAQSANVLSIAPCVGDPIFGPSGGLDLGFSMGSGTPGEASIMAEFAHSQGWNTVTLLTDTTLKYTQNQCAIFAKRLTDLGGTVASTYDYAQGDSVRETVSRIAAGPAPQAIVNCGYVPGGVTAAKELRDGGVTAPIISGFGMDGDYWTSGVPNLTDYYVVTYASKNGDDPDQAVNDAADSYEAAYGERPSVGGFVTGPTTLQAIKAAYESAGSWDGDQLTAAMETFDNENFLAGPTSFSADLHIAVDRPMRVLQVMDGKLVFVEQRTPDKVEFLQ